MTRMVDGRKEQVAVRNQTRNKEKHMNAKTFGLSDITTKSSLQTAKAGSFAQRETHTPHNHNKWARSDRDQTQWTPPKPNSHPLCPCSRPSAPNWTNTTIAVNAPSKHHEISLLHQRRCPFLELFSQSHCHRLMADKRRHTVSLPSKGSLEQNHPPNISDKQLMHR